MLSLKYYYKTAAQVDVVFNNCNKLQKFLVSGFYVAPLTDSYVNKIYNVQKKQHIERSSVYSQYSH